MGDNCDICGGEPGCAPLTATRGGSGCPLPTWRVRVALGLVDLGRTRAARGGNIVENRASLLQSTTISVR